MVRMDAGLLNCTTTIVLIETGSHPDDIKNLSPIAANILAAMKQTAQIVKQLKIMKTSNIDVHDMLSVWSVDEVEKHIGEVPGAKKIMRPLRLLLHQSKQQKRKPKLRKCRLY